MRSVVQLAILGIFAFVLQIVVAPNIAILGIMPSFVISLFLVAAVCVHSTSVVVLAAVFGLLIDLTCSQPVGMTSLLLVITTYGLSYFAAVADLEESFILLIPVALGCLLVEFCIGLFYCGISGVSFFEAFAMRMLPNGLYDCLISALWFLLVSRLMAPAAKKRSGQGVMLSNVR